MMPKTISMEPDWKGMARWYSLRVFGDQKVQVAAFIDTIRFLTLTDENYLFELMHELDPDRAATKEEALKRHANQDRSNSGD